MDIRYIFRTPTIIVLCLYIFWGGISIDTVLFPSVERYPLHRVFIALTFIILLFNFLQVFRVLLQNKVLFIFLLYILLTAAWAANASEVVKNFIFLSSALIISTLTALAFANNQIGLVRWLFWLFFLMMFASAFVAIFYPQIGINIKDFGKPRWIGITSHPNTLGAEGVALIWLSSNLLFLSKNYLEKPIIFVALVLAFYVIFKADSMTSFIDSFVVIGCVLYYYIINRLPLPIKLIFFFVISMLFLAVIGYYLEADKLSYSLFTTTGRSASFTGRTELWGKALLAAKDSYLFGYGFDDLQALTKKYRILMVHIHNGYLEIMVKGGVVAIMLLAFILIKTLIDQFRIKSNHINDVIFLGSGYIMILVHNITESSFFKGLNSLNILFILIIVFTGLLKSANKLTGLPSSRC